MDAEDVRLALTRLHADLRFIVEKDSEQKVQGIALPVLDAVVAAAREHVLAKDPVLSVLTGFITPEAVQAGAPIRALDAYLVVGQLIDAVNRAAPPEHLVG